MTPKTSTTDSAARLLRRWHLGSTDAAPLPADVLPLLLAPFRDPVRVRHDYPLVIDAGLAGLRVRALCDALQDWLPHARTQPRIVQDNLRRLERRVRLLLGLAPADAGALLRQAGEQMVAEMQLRPDIAGGVKGDLAAMWQAAGAALLLTLRRETAAELFAAAASSGVGSARARHAERLRELASGLRQRLFVEAQKDPAARAGAAIGRSLGGGAAQFLDAAALARTQGAHRGTQRLEPARRERMQQALQTLDAHLAAAPRPCCVAVTADGMAPADAEVVRSDDVCAAALARFEAEVAALLPVVRAAWLADLELRDAYDAERHEPMLAALGCHDLTADELHALPVVAALVPAERLAGREMQGLTRLLTSGRPVHVLAQETPARDPGHAGAQLAAAGARLELGYLGVAFREAFVQQSTAARPGHLVAGFQRALAGARPGLHVVDSGLEPDGSEPRLGAFLHAGAAIEGRAHPLFQYDPEAGETWARRLDFAQNPSPDSDWPAAETEIDGRRCALRFTFADYALLDPALRAEFTLVPDGAEERELIALGDYLELAGDDARHRVPFVWAVCGGDVARPQRVAMRRTLVTACRDRLRYWRTLQELAGVRNEYVREAVQRARQEAAEQAARERRALAEQHAEELARARDETAGTAMQGLARMLLELDPIAGQPMAGLGTAAAAPAPGAAAAPAAPAAAAPAAAPPAAAPAVEEEVSAEPWIESPRCSTCNDCVNLNSLLFVYDGNKQARIGDPRAGSYAQLVQAAEKCPSRCIHPGLPMNPDEPGLEALIARAAPFN
jgi:ferredoxin